MARTITKPEDIRVAVYAICKNESKFIDQWIQNIWCEGRGADQVFLLDTGSTDNSIQIFQDVLERYQIPTAWLQIKQQIVSPWRFDVARNINMNQIPTGAFDVFYCIDLDELVLPDFWADLRQTVFEHPNFERILYKYAWSHNEVTGEPEYVFWYDKIHGARGGWYWEYPVHEALNCNQEDKSALCYQGYYQLDENKIYLHHYPDQSKSRGSYLNLLKQRAVEYPNDLYGLYYLAREYSFKRDWKNSIITATGLYIQLLKDNPFQAEISARDDMKMLPALAALIGDGYLYLGMRSEAEFYYRKSVQYGPSYRAGYIKLAQLLAWKGRGTESAEVLRLMKQLTVRCNDWREVPLYWKDWKIKQIEADNLCWEGRLKEAQELFEEALREIEFLGDRQLAASESFFSDYKWCTDQLGC